jgi:hypothetical protein
MRTAYFCFTLAIAVFGAACGGKVELDEPGTVAPKPQDPAPSKGDPVHDTDLGRPDPLPGTTVSTDDIRVVPADATSVRLHYESLGVSPSAPGECTDDEAKYELDPVSRLLSGRHCQLVENELRWVPSQTILDATTSLVHVRAVLADLQEQPPPSVCGNDGPERILEVATPRGTETYYDADSPCGPAPQTRYTEYLSPLQRLFDSLLPSPGGEGGAKGG